jgi:hypothetical protein
VLRIRDKDLIHIFYVTVSSGYSIPSGSEREHEWPDQLRTGSPQSESWVQRKVVQQGVGGDSLKCVHSTGAVYRAGKGR